MSSPADSTASRATHMDVTGDNLSENTSENTANNSSVQDITMSPLSAPNGSPMTLVRRAQAAVQNASIEGVLTFQSDSSVLSSSYGSSNTTLPSFQSQFDYQEQRLRIHKRLRTLGNGAAPSPHLELMSPVRADDSMPIDDDSHIMLTSPAVRPHMRSSSLRKSIHLNSPRQKTPSFSPPGNLENQSERESSAHLDLHSPESSGNYTAAADEFEHVPVQLSSPHTPESRHSLQLDPNMLTASLTSASSGLASNASLETPVIPRRSSRLSNLSTSSGKGPTSAISKDGTGLSLASPRASTSHPASASSARISNEGERSRGSIKRSLDLQTPASSRISVGSESLSSNNLSSALSPGLSNLFTERESPDSTNTHLATTEERSKRSFAHLDSDPIAHSAPSEVVLSETSNEVSGSGALHRQSVSSGGDHPSVNLDAPKRRKTDIPTKPHVSSANHRRHSSWNHPLAIQTPAVQRHSIIPHPSPSANLPVSTSRNSSDDSVHRQPLIIPEPETDVQDETEGESLDNISTGFIHDRNNSSNHALAVRTPDQTEDISLNNVSIGLDRSNNRSHVSAIPTPAVQTHSAVSHPSPSANLPASTPRNSVDRQPLISHEPEAGVHDETERISVADISTGFIHQRSNSSNDVLVVQTPVVQRYSIVLRPRPSANLPVSTIETEDTSLNNISTGFSHNRSNTRSRASAIPIPGTQRHSVVPHPSPSANLPASTPRNSFNSSVPEVFLFRQPSITPKPRTGPRDETDNIALGNNSARFSDHRRSSPNLPLSVHTPVVERHSTASHPTPSASLLASTPRNSSDIPVHRQPSMASGTGTGAHEETHNIPFDNNSSAGFIGPRTSSQELPLSVQTPVVERLSIVPRATPSANLPVAPTPRNSTNVPDLESSIAPEPGTGARDDTEDISPDKSSAGLTHHHSDSPNHPLALQTPATQRDSIIRNQSDSPRTAATGRHSTNFPVNLPLPTAAEQGTDLQDSVEFLPVVHSFSERPETVHSMVVDPNVPDASDGSGGVNRLPSPDLPPITESLPLGPRSAPPEPSRMPACSIGLPSINTLFSLKPSATSGSASIRRSTMSTRDINTVVSPRPEASSASHSADVQRNTTMTTPSTSTLASPIRTTSSASGSTGVRRSTISTRDINTIASPRPDASSGSRSADIRRSLMTNPTTSILASAIRTAFSASGSADIRRSTTIIPEILSPQPESSLSNNFHGNPLDDSPGSPDSPSRLTDHVEATQSQLKENTGSRLRFPSAGGSSNSSARRRGRSPNAADPPGSSDVSSPRRTAGEDLPDTLNIVPTQDFQPSQNSSDSIHTNDSSISAESNTRQPSLSVLQKGPMPLPVRWQTPAWFANVPLFMTLLMGKWNQLLEEKKDQATLEDLRDLAIVASHQVIGPTADQKTENMNLLANDPQAKTYGWSDLHLILMRFMNNRDCPFEYYQKVAWLIPFPQLVKRLVPYRR